MNNIIIGTAGHVDHGKTCLIKVLSGIDTDRLKEEKKRGITIENGFANLPNDKNLHLGIIDVPGHEKFVKNMLAGIGGIDIVLLVISLEEGIKPQTIEHFEIIKSLGIKYGIVVYTKLDSENKVDFHNLQIQVKDLLKDSFMENCKQVCVSSFTNENIDLLKDMIFDIAKDIENKNIDKNTTRLPIDRVFTMEGFGTVVTGTLMEGKIDVNDELMLYPSMKIAKVRQIESHGKIEKEALAGQRTAINLSNIKKDEISRGDVLCKKDSIILSEYIDCNYKMFKNSKRLLKNGEKIHFNYGSKQTEAIVRLINDKYVQYRFEKPIPIKRNDKYIVRFISPEETCAGGIVLNVASKKRKINDINVINYFDALNTFDDKKALYLIVSDISYEYRDIDYISKKANISIDNINIIVDELIKEEKIVKFASYIVDKKIYDDMKNDVLTSLERLHKDNPLFKGIKREEIKSMLNKKYYALTDETSNAFISYLIDKKLIKQNDDMLSLYNFNVVITDDKNKDINKIIDIYKNAKFEPPENNEVVEIYAKGKSNNAKLECRQILVDLAKDGVLEKLSKDFYIHVDYYNIALNKMLEFFKTNDKMQMKDLRDMLNTSRKYAILLVDHFDQKRITKTVDGYRILIKKD